MDVSATIIDALTLLRNAPDNSGVFVTLVKSSISDNFTVSLLERSCNGA